MDPIQNKNSTVKIDENGVFVIEWKPNVTLEKEDFEVVVNNYDDLSQGALWKVLHIFPKNTTASSEARHFAANREKPAGAEAFVIHGMIQRNLFRFYRKFRTVRYPMREFSKTPDAMKWLGEIEIVQPTEQEA
ncbi:MAG: hypothetical protein HUJ25_05595 [Crocinitomicaceae bacterium]|nr:hypothetical protein [Crocinitomicaceae bacterium]